MYIYNTIYIYYSISHTHIIYIILYIYSAEQGIRRVRFLHSSLHRRAKLKKKTKNKRPKKNKKQKHTKKTKNKKTNPMSQALWPSRSSWFYFFSSPNSVS